jgi:cyclopropane-fatty-acyl-phospholipid synthase
MTRPGLSLAAAPAVDPARWPDVASVPNRPVRAAIARLLFAHACAALPL